MAELPPAPALTPDRVGRIYAQAAADGLSGGIMVHGVVREAAFAPGVIGRCRDEIRGMLAELPDQFRRASGGWSFLNACNDRYGNQWTGLHAVMEQLFMLGMSAGLVTEVFDRGMWPALPGGMPYYVIDL